MTVGDVNKEYFDRIHEAGGIIMHRPLNPDIASAKEAEDLGADLLVATGFYERSVKAAFALVL